MPPNPKAPGTRARRNKTTTAAVIAIDPDLAVPPLPPHPKADMGLDWHPMTQAMWDDVWSSPMAPEFDDSDIHGIYVYAMLVEDFWTSSSASMRRDIGAEIRLQGQRFGVSPLDRRRLQWQIATNEELEAKGRKRKAADTAKDAPNDGDARSVLRSV